MWINHRLQLIILHQNCFSCNKYTILIVGQAVCVCVCVCVCVMIDNMRTLYHMLSCHLWPLHAPIAEFDKCIVAENIVLVQGQFADFYSMLMTFVLKIFKK
jgi:hypothetical protein